MPQVTPQTTTQHRQLDWFRPDERELARHDDPEKIRLLGQDMLANGQLQAVGATEDARMIFGHGRLLAARSAMMKTLETKLFPASLSDTQFRLIRASENLQRKDLTGHQKWLLCTDLMCGNAGWQMKDLADAMHLDPSMVTRLLSPSKCIEPAQNALRDGKITISDTYALSKLPPSDQPGLLAMKLSGASRDTLEAAGRKKRNGTPMVKVSKIKAVLPSGVCIVASGEGLSLDDLIEALAEAGREAKKARDQGLDAKTFSAVMRDKSRKG